MWCYHVMLQGEWKHPPFFIPENSTHSKLGENFLQISILLRNMNKGLLNGVTYRGETASLAIQYSLACAWVSLDMMASTKYKLYK